MSGCPWSTFTTPSVAGGSNRPPHIYFDGMGAACQLLPHRDGFGPILNFNVAPD